jgi:hypothetical protein
MDIRNERTGLSPEDRQKLNVLGKEIKLLKDLRKGAEPKVQAELSAEISALVDEVNGLINPKSQPPNVYKLPYAPAYINMNIEDFK